MKIKKILIIIGICLASIGLLSCSVLLFDNNSNNSSGSSSSDEEIYTVTYDGNGATSLPVVYTRFKDYNKVNLVTPVKTGYIFDGWYEGDIKVEKLTENRDYNLKAKYNLIYYSISYELNGGAMTTCYKTRVEIVNDFMNDFNTYTEQNLTIDDYINLGSMNGISNESKFLYAYIDKWGWLVDFIKNVADSSNKSAWNSFKNYTSQSGLNEENPNYIYSIAYELRAFVGGFKYEKNSAFPTQDYSKTDVENKLWTFIPASEYTIVSDDIWLTNYVPIKEGYVFDGWYTSPSFTNHIGVIVSGKHENITLYAKWSKKYTITFDSNGGSDIDSFILSPGSYIDFASTDLYFPIRDGYNFVGWYDINEDVVNYLSYDEMDKDITLYAKWSRIQATYELYDENDSSNDNFILGNEVYVYIPLSQENDGEFYEQISLTTDLGIIIEPLYIHYSFVSDNLETGYYICAGDKSKDSIISAKGELIANLYDEHDEICGYIYKFIIDNEDIVISQYVIYPITEYYEYAYKGFRFVYNVQLPNEE